MKLEIVDIDHKGNGIARDNNKVIFIPKTITGDICEANIIKSYKNYDIAKLGKIIEKSPDRIDSVCPYYNVCGGCNISNLEYQKQMEFKVNKVKNIFKKYLNLDVSPLLIDSKDRLKYRNKITYHNSDKFGLIGEFDDVINIDKCYLVSDNINKLYEIIRKEDLSKVKKVIIRECDNGLMLDVSGDINVDRIKDYVISIYINGVCKYKKEDGYIVINDIKYIISNESFFQINTNNISRLYDEIIRYGNFSKKDKVIDLYCGVGSISLYISKYVESVLGIEIIEKAVKDARENAKINSIDNVEFLCGDVSKLVDDNINGNVLIVDPPRIGLDKHTISVINDRKIEKVIYVSCDPMTLVRDIKMFTNYYISNISVIDMFPQTHHVESICVLERN